MAAAAALCLMPGMAATSQGWKRYREAVGGRREPREPAPTPAAPILPRRRRQLPRRSARAKAAENATALAAALKRAKQSLIADFARGGRQECTARLATSSLCP